MGRVKAVSSVLGDYQEFSHLLVVAYEFHR